MKIKGKVTSSVNMCCRDSRFRIQIGEKEYEVLSRGKQAWKDYLFVRTGQNMVIDGLEQDGVILSEKARIELIPSDTEGKRDI